MVPAARGGGLVSGNRDEEAAEDVAADAAARGSRPAPTAETINNRMMDIVAGPPPRKAAGEDGIKNEALRAASHNVARQVAAVTAAALRGERLPSAWKASLMEAVPTKAGSADLG